MNQLLRNLGSSFFCFIAGSAALGKAFNISVDCGDITMQVAGHSPEYKIIKMGSLQPKISVSKDGIDILHGSSQGHKHNCSKLLLTVPVARDLEVSMGAGNLVFPGSDKLNQTFEISASVGAGNIRSQVAGIRTKRFIASDSASNSQEQAKNQLSASLGAGNISFDR